MLFYDDIFHNAAESFFIRTAASDVIDKFQNQVGASVPAEFSTNFGDHAKNVSTTRDLNTPGKEVAEVLNKLTPRWDEMFPAEHNRLMHLLLKKVTLYEDHLDLDIRTAGVEQILEELDYEDHD